MNVCVIPVRKNSRRVPRKNFRTFAGQSLLELAINKAKQSNLFEKIFVASDDPEGLEIARRLDVDFWWRTEESSGGERFLIEVISEFIDSIRLDANDILTVKLATNPFCHSEDINIGLDRYLNDRSRGVASFSEIKVRSHLIFKKSGEYLKPVDLVRYQSNTKSDAGNSEFYFNEGFVIDSVANWISRNTLLPSTVIPVFTDAPGYFIDSEEDFMFAELIYRKLIGAVND